jgi:hypothetical protein
MVCGHPGGVHLLPAQLAGAAADGLSDWFFACLSGRTTRRRAGGALLGRALPRVSGPGTFGGVRSGVVPIAERKSSHAGIAGAAQGRRLSVAAHYGVERPPAFAQLCGDRVLPVRGCLHFRGHYRPERGQAYQWLWSKNLALLLQQTASHRGHPVSAPFWGDTEMGSASSRRCSRRKFLPSASWPVVSARRFSLVLILSCTPLLAAGTVR